MLLFSQRNSRDLAPLPQSTILSNSPKCCDSLAICITGGFRGGEVCASTHIQSIVEPNLHWRRIGFFLTTWSDRQCVNRNAAENRGSLAVTEELLRRVYNGSNVSFIFIGNVDDHGPPNWVYRSKGYHEGRWPYQSSQGLIEGASRMTRLWEVCLAAVPKTYEVIVRFRFDVCFPQGWSLRFTCPRGEPMRNRIARCWDVFRDDKGLPGVLDAIGESSLVILEIGVGGLEQCREECNRNSHCNSFTFCARNHWYIAQPCTLSNRSFHELQDSPQVNSGQGNENVYCASYVTVDCKADAGEQIISRDWVVEEGSPWFEVTNQAQSYSSVLEGTSVYMFECTFHREFGIGGTTPDDSLSWGLSQPMRAVYGTLRAKADAGDYNVGDEEYTKNWGHPLNETGKDNVDNPAALLNPAGAWVRERYPEKLLKHHILSTGHKYHFLSAPSLAVYGQSFYKRGC